jgi:hypothetical protein
MGSRGSEYRHSSRTKALRTFKAAVYVISRLIFVDDDDDDRLEGGHRGGTRATPVRLFYGSSPTSIISFHIVVFLSCTNGDAHDVNVNGRKCCVRGRETSKQQQQQQQQHNFVELLIVQSVIISGAGATCCVLLLLLPVAPDFPGGVLLPSTVSLRRCSTQEDCDSIIFLKSA